LSLLRAILRASVTNYEDSLSQVLAARALTAAPEAQPAVEFAAEWLQFQPDPKQRLVLESKSRRGILLCSRQWGKSTVSAIKAVHRAFTVPESLVVVASPSERQSAEWVRKAERFVRMLGIRPVGDGDNAQSVKLPNGSRIVGLPGNEATVRGFSAVSLLVIDEAARVKDELYWALRPMLSVGGGDLWLMSTPFGKRGFFHEEWSDGGPEWERVAGTADECPRIAPEFLEEEKRKLGRAWFEQEYMCTFNDAGGELFGAELLDGCLGEQEPLRIARQ
jgi:hypothetical protein